MPRYTQQITSLMAWDQFTQDLETIPDANQRALLAVLFLTGCRISEALALTVRDVRYDHVTETHYITFKRLKGSHRTDPIEIPAIRLVDPVWITSTERLFPYGYKRIYRLIKKTWSGYYPHYFRMNRITTLLQAGATIPEIQAVTGLSLNAIQHYIAHVGVKRVGQMLKKEVLKA